MLVLLDDCHSKTIVNEDKVGNMSIGQMKVGAMASGRHRLAEYNSPVKNNDAGLSSEDMIEEIKISLESRTLKLL